MALQLILDEGTNNALTSDLRVDDNISINGNNGSVKSPRHLSNKLQSSVRGKFIERIIFQHL